MKQIIAAWQTVLKIRESMIPEKLLLISSNSWDQNICLFVQFRDMGGEGEHRTDSNLVMLPCVVLSVRTHES